MKAMFSVILLCICLDIYAQTKKAPIVLIRFTVDKTTGKAFVKYSYIESLGVKYNVDAKGADSKWTTIYELSEYPVVALDNGKTVNKTDTFTIHIEKDVRQVRLLFIEPKSGNQVTKVVNIP